MKKYKDMGVKERFSAMLLDQMNALFKKYDWNLNQQYENHEIEHIMNEVFKKGIFETNRIMKVIDIVYSSSLSKDSMVSIALACHFCVEGFELQEQHEKTLIIEE